MCGINGFVLDKSTSVDENINRINKMNSLITYRGPDSDGIYTDAAVGLGMRRLAIIDLSTGKQPIFNEDGTKVIVFNGEIYNFKELRDDLIMKGHKFTTKGDTEVILHSYEEYGTKCLDKLNGMFAFAIYDIKNREMFIARDRAGEKPLYYHKDHERFIFASELKSIIKTFDIKKEINKTALNQYFSLTYIPAPLTIFEKIFKLEAGSFILYKDGNLKIERYWNIDSREAEPIQSYDECKRRLREALFTSVEQKMISDVPLGAFLSGGIDSSIMVGIMSKLSNRPVETFTIGFKLKEFDESDRAQIVSQKNKTNHHIHFLDYTHAVSELENILETFDEPFADSSAIPTYFVSKFAGEHVKVVLTGDAGDELFGGYSKYMVNYYTDMYNRVPGVLRKNLIEPLIYRIPDRSSFSRKVRKVVESSEKEMYEKRRELMFLGFNGDKIGKLLKTENINSNSYDIIEKAYNKNPEFDELTRTLYTDFKIVLEGDMLVKVDRMSMLNSIETRVPMLDRSVIELAFKMPSNFKISGRNQKYILKDTFKDLIPQEVLGKSKRGFAVPIGEWFKGPLKDLLLGLLSREFIIEQGIFEYEYIESLLEDHFAERVNNAYPLWALFVFQKWYSKYYNY
jgi:asparagine synthase (glutamine-hydrolysing)